MVFGPEDLPERFGKIKGKYFKILYKSISFGFKLRLPVPQGSYSVVVLHLGSNIRNYYKLTAAIRISMIIDLNYIHY